MGDNSWSLSRGGDMVISWRVSMPMDDWESFRCAVKKSVSSYTALSGELEEDEADIDRPASGNGDRDRAIMF